MTYFLKDIRMQLRHLYGREYPEFTVARRRGGYWQVYVINIGWVRTTDLLQA